MILHAGASAQVGANRFADYYHASPGLDVGAAVPFRASAIGAGLELRRYERRSGRATEDLWAVPATLRWRVGLPLDNFLPVARLRAEVSTRLGLLQMRLSGGGRGQRNESELLMGGGAGLTWEANARWRFVASTRYEQVFTAPYYVRLWQVSVGVRRNLDAPGWLQTLLR